MTLIRHLSWVAVLSLLLVLLPGTALARVEVHNFDSAQQENTYNDLINELRCPKCQNQNLAGSDSALALDLRQKVYEQLKAGQDSGEIRQYMVDRYGDFVTYKPPMKPQTLILWGLPWLVIGLAGISILWQRAKRPQKTAALSAEEQDRLAAILAESDAATEASASAAETVGIAAAKGDKAS